MKAKFEDVDSSVSDMVYALMTKFPDRFLHINKQDLYCVFKNCEKNNFVAKTNVTNGLYRALTKKKIIIQIHKQEWSLMKEADHALLLFRELSKIDLNQKDKSEYKLIKFDLIDFKSILQKIGLNHEHKEEFFAKVLTTVAK